MVKRLTGNNPRTEQIRQQRLLLALEMRFARRFASEISRQSRDFISRYKATGMPPPLMRTHRENVQEIYEQLVRVSVEIFGQRVLEQGKASGQILETKDFEETFRKLSRQYINLEMIRQRITSVSDTTRQQIVDQIRRGELQGMGVDEIARAITKAVPLISRQRGALISRTETHGAANYGADAAAKETGLRLRKEWIAASDERTRQEHADADGQIVNMDEPFRVGGELLMYPGDPAGSAGNVINCRCSVSHIVEDDLV